MIKDYYRIRGWEADGRITPQKLIALGLNSTPI
jgi:aldehyde:ferredoxin oxidoreductase